MQTAQSALQVIVTIGYEGATLEDFLATLQHERVTRVLDVRALANSRRRGFAKTALRTALAEVDIGYRHEPMLGTPKPIRERQRNDHDRARFFRDFDAYLHTQAALLDRLARELTGRVALLCFERDVDHCHRRSVAAALQERTRSQVIHAVVERS